MMLLNCRCQCGKHFYDKIIIRRIHNNWRKNFRLRFVSTCSFSIISIRIPFNWKNSLFEYLIAVIYQSILASFVLHHVACFISFALGGYLFLTFNKAYMIDNLKSINKMVKDKKPKLRKAKDRKPRTDRISNQLRSFIRMHADIKQLSE